MARAAAKVESLKEYDVVKDSAHVGAVMAYTDETDLYTQLIALACVVVAYESCGRCSYALCSYGLCSYSPFSCGLSDR